MRLGICFVHFVVGRWLRMRKCNEDCQLFRWHRCETKDKVNWLCDQPERYDNAQNEWGDWDHLREMEE